MVLRPASRGCVAVSVVIARPGVVLQGHGARHPAEGRVISRLVLHDGGQVEHARCNV